MQGQKDVVGSLPDTIGLPLLSPALPVTIGLPLLSNDSTVDQQIFWNNTTNSANPVPNGNSISLGGWSASSSSSSSPFNGDGSLSGLSQLEPVPALPSFAESSNSQQAASRRDLNMILEAENSDDESQIVQHPNCKRKAIEGQSSRNAETNVCPSIPSIGSLSTSIPTPAAHNNSVFPTEHMNPRLTLAIGTASEIPLTLNVSSGGNTGNSHRNVRARTNSSSRSQNEITPANIVENSHNSPQIQFSRFLSLNGASERALPTDSTISRRRAAVGPRRAQISSRWNRGSSSRQHDNPQPTLAVSSGPGESNTTSNSTNLNLSGGNLSGSISRSTSPIWLPNQYPTRRFDLFQRSLAAAEFSPVSTPNLQETEIPTGVGEVMLPQLRQVDSTSGLPHSLRTPPVASAANARRSRIMTELRNALDLMRNGGDGLRAEDVMFLQQSMFFRMADAHRDMRLDVDNMSYEELLALEDRIGYVSTGLSEETITNQLKKRKYFAITMDSQTEFEPCCICQEEYIDGKDIGTLDCGHEFHAGCIKQWLTHKNVCPICKATGLDIKNNNNNSS